MPLPDPNNLASPDSLLNSVAAAPGIGTEGDMTDAESS
jgi:hypothetical protein